MNVKRNLLTSFLLTALVGVVAGVAGAADQSKPVRLGDYGTQVQSGLDSAKAIKISSTTGTVYVDHFGTVKFENGRGQSFAWNFDSTMELTSFPLRTIAPGGFDAGNTWVAILHPMSHTAP